MKYYSWNSRKVEVINEFSLEKISYVVVKDEDRGTLDVTSFTELIPWEESYQYRSEQDRIKKWEDIKKQEDKFVERVQVKALKSLESRLRINSAFSDDGKIAQVGIAVAGELKKIIEQYKLSDIKQS